MPFYFTKLEDTQRAYIAGYTDAEGCISISGGYVFVQFRQSQPEVVDWLASIYRGRFFYETCTGYKTIKRWRLSVQDDVLRFLVDVFPFMREKREQADVAIGALSAQAPLDGQWDDTDYKKALSDLKKIVPIVELTKRTVIAGRDLNKLCQKCGGPGFARGFCGAHYQEAKRNGLLKTRAKKDGVPFVYGRAPTDLEKSYYAGYFDGDGCVLICPSKKSWLIRVKFQQTQPHVCRELQTIYGGSLLLHKSRHPATRKDQFIYQLTQQKASRQFLQDIAPFVVEKKDQVQALLTRFDPHLSAADGLALQEDLRAMKRKEIVLPT